MSTVHGRLLFAAFVFLTSASCERFAKVSKLASDIGGAACSPLEDGKFEELTVEGSAQTRTKVMAFLKSVHRLKADIKAGERAIYDLCVDVALQTGTSKSEVKKIVADPKKDSDDKPSIGSLIDQLPEEGTAKLSRICAVAMQGFRNSGVKVHVAYAAPTCSLDVDGFARCLNDCGAPMDAGKLAASCKGKVAASCEGQCKGDCEGSVNNSCKGSCSGECNGTCEGTFKGSCSGSCEGSCDGAPASGACAGVCEGKCSSGAQGECSGTCAGSCSLECKDNTQVSCDGVCHGQCSGKVSKVSCEGDFTPPVVNASCHAACMSEAETQLSCTPPTAELQIVGASPALEHDLRGRLPLALDVLLTRSKRIITTAESVVSAGAALQGSLSDAGSDAVTCVTAAVAITTSASLSFQGSLKASADIKGIATNPL